MTTVRIETGQCASNRICVNFPYDQQAVYKVRGINGRTFVKEPHKHWHVPLDMEVCRQLREAFGRDLEIGPKLYSWAENAKRQEHTLGTLALADTAELQRLQHHLPLLYEAIHVGPKGLILTPAERKAALKGPASFQAADVRFLVESPNPLNGNQQGTGKTPEWIAAVWEAGLEAGNHLVIAPGAAVDGTWEPELEKWQEDAKVEVGIFACTGTRAQREEVLDQWQASTAPVKWVVVNPQMLQYKKDDTNTSKIILPVSPTTKAALTACKCDARKGPHTHYTEPYPILHETQWDTVCIDECHKGNIRNHKSLTAKSIHAIKTAKKTAMSGTPMKKKGADIWGILHWLRPDIFTSYWRLAEGYFEIDDNGFGKKVLELRRDREESFYRMLIPYVVRRTKAEVLTWLPPKHYVEVQCAMTAGQSKQYRQMEKDGAATLADTTLNTTGVLSELTRLSQFSFGKWEMRDGKLRPTEDSGKLEALLQKMDEADLFEDKSVKQLVFSQSREIVELVARVLEGKGVQVQVLSGKQNRKGHRRAIREAFQAGDTQVLCIVTTAGGVSLTLDAADTVHMLDDMWAPDETEQAEDRAHRASRVHQVTVYQYRTKDSIDQYRAEMAEGKAVQHKRIMDARKAIVDRWLKSQEKK